MSYKNSLVTYKICQVASKTIRLADKICQMANKIIRLADIICQEATKIIRLANKICQVATKTIRLANRVGLKANNISLYSFLTSHYIFLSLGYSPQKNDYISTIKKCR